MRTISLTELKATLSEQMRFVRTGQRLLVTQRGRAIGMVVPVAADELGRDVPAHLIDDGLVSAPKQRLADGFFAAPRPADPDATLRGAVEEEREGGW